MIAIDLFSGAGGMSLGFKSVGFNVLAAFDYDIKHIITYQQNYPQTKAICKDIREIDASYLFDICGKKQQIDVIFGGPPCQGFSVGGKGNVEDLRNSLFLEFARIVCEVRPRIFVAENVGGILASKYRPLIQSFYDMVRKAGYLITDSPYVLRAEEFGVPQSRKRVFFIGALSPLSVPKYPTPVYSGKLSHLLKTTVWDALSDLPLLQELDYLFNQDRYTGVLEEPTEYVLGLQRFKAYNLNREAGIGGFLKTLHSDEVKQRFASTAQGQRETISKFFRLAWNGIAPTLRAGTTRTNGQFMAPRPIHPTENRVITVREAARLHSYPDWFEFYPTKWYGFMQIGNSVPPLLAEAVASSVMDSLT